MLQRLDKDMVRLSRTQIGKTNGCDENRGYAVKFDGNVTIFAVLAALNRSHDAFTGLADVKPTALYTCLGARHLPGRGAERHGLFGSSNPLTNDVFQREPAYQRTVVIDDVELAHSVRLRG